MDFEDFSMKIESLKCQWEALSPGFRAWLLSKRRTIFIDWVVQSLRQSTDIEGLYYQTDIESKYAAEKRNQHFRKEIIEIAVSNLHALVKREENDEIRAIYGVGS